MRTFYFKDKYDPLLSTLFSEAATIPKNINNQVQPKQTNILRTETAMSSSSSPSSVPSSLLSSCYATITAQCLSQDGVYLAVGQSGTSKSNSGMVGVWKVLELLDHRPQPLTRFSLPKGKGPITALAATKEELLVGGFNLIFRRSAV